MLLPTQGICPCQQAWGRSSTEVKTRTQPQSIPVVPVFAHVLSAYWLALAVWLMVFHLVLACRHRTIAEKSCV